MTGDELSLLEFGILAILCVSVVLSFTLVYFQTYMDSLVELLLVVLISVNITSLSFQARNHVKNKKG